MGAALRFKHVSVPRQQGEQARLKVVQGPDFGAVYVITGTRVTLGRGEENDIMVSDLKASRRHAEFELTPNGWTVKDIGSANGLLHNGQNTRSSAIKTGDSLTFGETTLEFMAGEAGTLMLVAPPRSSTDLQTSNAAWEKQRQNARTFGLIQGGQGVQVAGAAPNRRVLIYGALGVAALFAMFGGETSKKLIPRKKGAVIEDLRNYLPGETMDPVTTKSVDQFFRSGFREYMAGNYLRAKSHFETVLQMAPGHSLATLYLENCERDIKLEVELHLKRGKQGISSGRLKDARGHYESVLRILFREQSNPAFIEARDQLEVVNKLMNGEAKS